MTQVASFTFNPFQENTYIVYDETKECVIIDPGCYEPQEKATLADFIEQKGLKPVRLLNTHAHIDHILGNRFVSEKYNIGLEIHKDEVAGLRAAPQYGMMWGFNVEPSPQPSNYLKEGNVVTFGNTSLAVLFTPGHSIAHVSFYCQASHFIISGDVLFRSSIGRTDLPGGNYNLLIEVIKTKLFTLVDKTIVYSGHGPATTIGFERRANPFFG